MLTNPVLFGLKVKFGDPIMRVLILQIEPILTIL